MRSTTMLAPVERTLERLDPLSAAAARPVTIGIAILSLALPPLTIAARLDEVTQPVWLAVAVAALVVAAALMLDRIGVHRPPWAHRSAQIFQVLLAVVLVAAALSTAGANDRLRDDWAPLVVGILLVALAPYRPAGEIAFWTALHTVTCALLGIIQADSAISETPTFTYAITGSFSVAVLGFASASYARSLNGSIERWHERAWQAAGDAARVSRGGVARSVQQRRVTLLNQDVVPYLTRVVAAETLTDDEREQARLLARSIRQLLVADVEKSWAQSLLDEAISRHPRLRITTIVDDPDDAGLRAALEQRTVLRALAYESVDELGASEIVLRLRESGGRLWVRWELATSRPIPEARRALRPLIEVIRGLTERARVEELDDRLVLEFEYGF